MGPNTWNTHKLPTATTPLCSAFHLSRQQQCPLSLDISLTVTNKQSLQLFRSNFLAQILVLHYHMLRLLQGKHLSASCLSEAASKASGIGPEGSSKILKRKLKKTKIAPDFFSSCCQILLSANIRNRILNRIATNFKIMII